MIGIIKQTREELVDMIVKLKFKNELLHGENERLQAKINTLQTLLNEARGPEGELPERVAEWLRGKGYTVTKGEPEFRCNERRN